MLKTTMQSIANYFAQLMNTSVTMMSFQIAKTIQLR